MNTRGRQSEASNLVVEDSHSSTDTMAPILDMLREILARIERLERPYPPARPRSPSPALRFDVRCRGYDPPRPFTEVQSRALNASGAYYLCSACRFEHAESLFIPMQIKLFPNQRVCKMSQRRLYLTDRLGIDFADLKAVLSEAKMRTGKELVVYNHAHPWSCVGPGLTIIYNHSDWGNEGDNELSRDHANDYRVHVCLQVLGKRSYDSVFTNRIPCGTELEDWIRESVGTCYEVLCPHLVVANTLPWSARQSPLLRTASERIGPRPEGPELSRRSTCYMACRKPGCDMSYALLRCNASVANYSTAEQGADPSHVGLYVEAERRLGNLLDANEPGWMSQTTDNFTSWIEKFWPPCKFSLRTDGAGRAVLVATPSSRQGNTLKIKLNDSG